LAALSLLLGQNAAWGEELESAPQPGDVGGGAPAQKSALATDTPCCVQQACNGEMCINRSWIVDIDAVFLAPIQSQHFGVAGLATLDSRSTPDNVILGTVLGGVETTNDNDFTISPRVTLGVQGECWGVLARYWRMQTGDLDAQFVPGNGLGAGGEGAQGASSFKAETFDLELTRILSSGCDCGMLRVSGGFRYAQLHEAADLAFSATNLGLGYYQTSVFAKQNFSGPGLTMGLQGYRPVGCGNFNLFFDARASIIFDTDADNYVATRADWVGTTPGHVFNDALSSNSNATMFIGEVQAGGQWNLPLKCVPANAFLRVAFEYQYWCTSNAGYAAAISATGPVGNPVGFAAGLSDGDTHVNLVGFNIATGLTW